MLDYLKTLHKQKSTQAGLLQIATGLVLALTGDKATGLGMIYAGIGAVLFPEKPKLISYD